MIGLLQPKIVPMFGNSGKSNISIQRSKPAHTLYLTVFRIRLWAIVPTAYNISDKKYDLDDLRAALFNSTTQSGARFRRQVEIDRLGKGITPRLTSNGMNFHRWAKSLTRLVERTHVKKDYFGTEDNDPDSERNAEIRTYIE
ncbi:hypothetical protein O181_037804 [Austropuccinia psidii MF-1]|uniref:Uncharacterized protein n=1 Tax=Austropuccinia psidii MF-1 TaxID=1389203 RepID=A0A9Q3D797_9BASI|nr:hypothetical protein [Austropuccinia psidii MF-1]